MSHADLDAMQRRMFDEFHRTMVTMFDGLATLARESSAAARAEFEEVRRLDDEIETLRQADRLAEAIDLSARRNHHWARVLELVTSRD